MTIVHSPSELVKKMAPPAKLKRLVTSDLTLNRAMLSMFSDIDFISKKTLKSVILKAIKVYKNRFETEAVSKATALAGKKLLVQRVQNAIVKQLSSEIKESYRGEFYKWLPSSAATPDPLHQLKYGKTFKVGDGEMPGDRFGCRCGMQLLVKGDKLDL